MDGSQNGADFKYRAFISYSHSDESWAQWLQKALETYRMPSRLVGTRTSAGVIPRRVSPIFRDRSELPSASNLTRKVNEAIAASASLIVICSPRSAASRYVDQEITTFKSLGREDRIFCIIVDGEPDACFAPALLKEGGVPIAADLRTGRDGRNDGKLKLIAGLFELGLDDLKRREQHRRMRRMVAITTASTLAAVVTSALALEAVLSRRSAIEARQAAERHQKQAEALVDFVLGDLSDKLGQVQRLDIMEAADDQAMRYFESLPVTDVTDQALAQRVRALEKIGIIRAARGNLPAALESNRAAAAVAREYAERAPNDAKRLALYGTSLNWVGNSFWFQGDLDHSLENFRRSIDLLEKSASALPRDSTVMVDLASARTNAGRVLEKRGQFAEAKGLYQQVRQTFDSLAKREPKNPDWLSQLGDAYDNLGKIALEQGQLAQAIAAYEEDQRIKADLAARDPRSNLARDDLLVSDAILGRTLALVGAYDAAIRFLREAVHLAGELVAFDATQLGWRQDLANYSRLLVGLLRQTGDLDGAWSADEKAIRLLRELVTSDATNATWRPMLVLAQLEETRLRLARRQDDAAQRSLSAAVASVHELQSRNPDDVDLKRLAINAEILDGVMAARHHDRQKAREHWSTARDTAESLARLGDDPNILEVWASAQLLLDDEGGAQPVLQKLAAMGYRTHDFESLLAAKRVPYVVDPELVRRIMGGTDGASRPEARAASMR